MKILRHWKLLVTLVLVFAAGAVSGTVWTFSKFKRSFEQGFDLDKMTAGAMAHFQRKLNLTEEQQPKVKAILDEGALEMKARFILTAQDTGDVLLRTWTKMDAELTPEQRIIHRQMGEEFRQRLRKVLKIELPEPEGSRPPN